ncbi:MAG: hypothetical protein ABI977_15100 [Acidobacteriota bacterium]
MAVTIIECRRNDQVIFKQILRVRNIVCSNRAARLYFVASQAHADCSQFHFRQSQYLYANSAGFGNQPKSTKKYLERYGEQLICVRYRYVQQSHKCFTIVEKFGWPPTKKTSVVGLRVELKETDIQRGIKQADGKWSPEKRIWEISCDQAVALGMKERIIQLEMSELRH